MREKPYFMSDKSWYYYDPEEFKYKLTDKAPEDAVKDYQEFYKTEVEVNGKKAVIDY